MKTGTKNRLAVAAAAVMCGLAALAMPTRDELVQAQKIVEDLTADDVRALKTGAKKAGEVAAAQLALADEAETEAGKYLLLQGAFKLYARSADYDAAAGALARMRKEIAGLPPEVVVELVNGEMRRVAADKAPGVLAIFRDAQRMIKCRKELAAAESAAKARPGDQATQRRLAECHAGLGDWPKALEIFAKAGDEAAKYELDPSSAKGYDALKAANYWWDYAAKDDEPFKVHAAVLYRKGLADGSISGLRKTLAEKRLKQMESLLPAEGEASARGSGTLAAIVKAPDADAKRPMKIQLGGGLDLELLPCPAGTYTMGTRPSGAWKAHRVTISRSFWMAKYPVTYVQAKAITGKTCTEKNQWGVPPFPWNVLGGDKTPAGMSPKQALDFLETMNRRYASYLPKGYVFRFPTEAEWEYAMLGGEKWGSALYERLAVSADERQKAMEDKGLKVKNFEKFPWVLPHLAVGTKEPNNWGICDLLGNGWTYLLDTVEGDHSSRRFIDAEIMADLYKDGEVDPVPYYEGVGKRIVMRGSGWGQAKFNGKAHNKVLFSSANVFHHDGHIRLVIGPDLLKERGIKLPDLGK